LGGGDPLFYGADDGRCHDDREELMLRRLYHDQPDSFTFTDANLAWAQGQIAKFPAGRQASAIIPLLWRAQEQEGWLTRPAIEYVANMLDMAYMRAIEVASFYFMFQLQPVGKIAHIQVCGTLSCMICGAEDLIAVCRDKIADKAHELSADGNFSWEEVECLGSCANAPMAQIGKDYYEDLTAARLAEIIDELAAGRVPVPGPQNGRFAAEPLGGLTSLTAFNTGKAQYNASAQAAVDIGDTVKRIDGTEVPLLTPWISTPSAKAAKKAAPKPAPVAEAPAETVAESQPATMAAPRASGADDLKKITGVGPKLEKLLNEMGFWHYDQIAAWGAGEIAWVDARLKFKGRITRDGWIAQAVDLAKK
jgi:NADH-quinone oxidoreductase subunit E